MLKNSSEFESQVRNQSTMILVTEVDVETTEEGNRPWANGVADQETPSCGYQIPPNIV